MSQITSTKYKSVVVLLSGGLDSSTLAYYVVQRCKKYQKPRIYTLTVDYGQRHAVELRSARKIAKAITSTTHKVVKLDLTQWGGSSLTDIKQKIPLARSNHIPSTYVPARNTILLSLALAYAEAVKADEIYIGVNYVDYSGYVDCRPKFIKKFQELADVATVSSVAKKHKIKIKTPLLYMSKTEIVKLGLRLGVDWKSTWSCYKGGKLACGRCDSCRLRLKGFANANIKDPLKYRYYPLFYKKFLRMPM